LSCFSRGLPTEKRNKLIVISTIQTPLFIEKINTLIK
jgi:hypothetical protein